MLEKMPCLHQNESRHLSIISCLLECEIIQCHLADFEIKKGKSIGKGGQGKAKIVSSSTGNDTFVYKSYNNDRGFWRELEVSGWLDPNAFLIEPICIIPEQKAVMLPYLEKGDLSGIPEGTPDSDITRWSAQLITAVEAMHINGFVHADIKPKNIGLTARGKEKIVLFDFGLSMRKDRIRARVGTATTMAPEMALKEYEDTLLTDAIDWWSVGSTIWQLFAMSRIPKEKRTEKKRQIYPYELIRDKKTGEYLHYVNNPFPSHFSTELKSLVSMLMDPIPENRRFDLFIHRLKGHPLFSSIDWNSL